MITLSPPWEYDTTTFHCGMTYTHHKLFVGVIFGLSHCLSMQVCLQHFVHESKKRKSKTISIAHWGLSSISISQAPLPGVKDCNKKKKKGKTLTHPYKHTCTLHLPTFVHIYTQRHTPFSQKDSPTLTGVHTHTYTQLHKHPRSLAEKRQKSEWESRHLDEQIMV